MEALALLGRFSGISGELAYTMINILASPFKTKCPR